MQLQDALRDGPSFLRNAQDAATRSPGNPDTLYMWDNQVTAIESFIAATEDLSKENEQLAQTRKELFDLKKQIQNRVLEFEMKQEGQEVPPEPTEAELIQDMTEFGREVQALCKELNRAQIGNVKELEELELPRQQLNAFIVDSEPLAGKDATLDKLRAVAKGTRKQLEARIADLVKAWRQQDLQGGDDDEE